MSLGRDRARVLLLAVLMLAGAAAARAALAGLHADDPQAATAFALRQPVAIATAWPAPEGPLVMGVWCATILGCAGLYARLLRAGTLSRRTTVLGAAALAAAATAWPVVWSSDVVAYGAYGREALLGISPYAHANLDPRDPIFAAAAAQWGNPPPICAYGPGFVALAAVAAAIAGTDPVLLGIVLRAFAIAGFLAATALADTLGGRTAAAAIGLNPVLAWTAAEGHNDALALACVLGAVLALKRTPAGAGLTGLAALVKAPAALAALATIAQPGLGGAERVRRAAWAAGGLAVALLGTVPMLGGYLAHRGDAYVGGTEPYGLTGVLGSFAGPLAECAAIACVLVLGGALAARGFRAGESRGFAILGLALWYALPNAYPWYGVWLAALFPFVAGSATGTALLAATIVAGVRYLPDTLASAPSAWLIVLIVWSPLLTLARPRPSLESP